MQMPIRGSIYPKDIKSYYMKVSTLLFVVTTTICYSQDIIDVAETTLKVPGLGEEVFYYGLSEGDVIVLNFDELNGKELKEFEFSELQSSSTKFMEYKIKKIVDKRLTISATGIYKFRLANSAIGGRVCRFKLQRIPSDEQSKKFNTTVFWRTSYDSIYTPVEEKYLVKADTSIITVIDQVSKVVSQSALNGASNRTVVDFDLPTNTIAWSYFIGVGNEGKAAYEAGKEKFVQEAASTLSAIPQYGPMAALALYGINTFSKANGNDNVQYWFITDWNNVLAFKGAALFYQYKQGNVISDAAPMKDPLSGKIYLGLLNDNIMDAIEVNVKVTAIQVNQVWGTRVKNQLTVNTRQVAYLKN
jgi:hypothetical protein